MSARINRKHQPNPALYTRGAAVYREHADVSGLSEADLLALDHYVDHMVMLPRGGLKLKVAVREEKKKRGI